MKKIIFLSLIVLNLLFCGVVYSQSVNRELSDNLLRLHVISNSNSDYDTKVKFMVRDKINEIIKKVNFKNKEEVINELYIVEKEINEYLKESDVLYGCKIEYTVSSFPTKVYNNIKMPSGEYECIKALLGDADGENWWCVAYPPLCFSEAVTGTISQNGEELLYNNLSEDAFGIIHKNDCEYNVKFLTVDLINKFINKIKSF